MAGSNVLHISGMRIRVWGNGTLRTAILGFQNVITQQLQDVTLTAAAASSRKVDRLANFISQGNKWRLHQDGVVGDFMRVNDITMFVKEIWSEYPQ